MLPFRSVAPCLPGLINWDASTWKGLKSRALTAPECFCLWAITGSFPEDKMWVTLYRVSMPLSPPPAMTPEASRSPLPKLPQISLWNLQRGGTGISNNSGPHQSIENGHFVSLCHYAGIPNLRACLSPSFPRCRTEVSSAWPCPLAEKNTSNRLLHLILPTQITILIDNFLCTRHCFKCFTCISRSTIPWGIYLIFNWGKWGTEKLQNFCYTASNFTPIWWGNSVRLFFWAPKSLQMVISAMKVKDTDSLEGKLWPT